MGSKEEGGRLYRKLSLPARFGSRASLRKSPKPTPTTSRPPAPIPRTLRKTSSTSPETSSLRPTPKPPELTPKPEEPALEPRTRILLSNGHATAILQGLDHFRSDKTLCDVTLESGDGSETFPVHRVIMASASEYFRTAFTGGMLAQGVVRLAGVSGRGLRSVVDFVYTGGLRLDMDSLRDTLEAANQLQVQPVLQLCNQLLSSELTVDNCLEVSSIAAELQLESAQERVQEFVCANFSALVQSGRYLGLAPPCLSHALSSDSLRGFTEAELYRLACDWLDQDPGGRARHTHSVMSCVRFPLMAPAELLRISHTDTRLRSDPDCAQLLLEASTYQTLPYLQPCLQSSRTRVRSDSSDLLLLGGVTQRHLSVSGQLCFYDNEAEAWRGLRGMEEPLYQHAVALLGGFLFAVGGQSRYHAQGAGATDSAHRYDPRTDLWLRLAPLRERRTCFTLSALQGALYAVGGRNSSSELSSVERYDFRKNEWAFVSPMTEPLYGHAEAVHEDLLYLSGGISRDSFQKALWRYAAGEDEWTRLEDMVVGRGLHCMAAVGDRLYVMGGNVSRGNGEYADVLSVEFYCPRAGQWSAAAPLPLGQSDVGVALCDGQLYLLGGYAFSGRAMVDGVQCYDPQRDVWEEACGLPEPMGGARACALPLPLTTHPPTGPPHQYPLDIPPHNHTHQNSLHTPPTQDRA
ncbi:hypothetical protein COCON_G00056240 [Conger conger]|uniref:BTB domain-containing protein n=1 Tax=Conger conger TaxID=82655 RepID=A0A9Q1DWF7_CONCO|nr:hypothetical protein COCON_G00056240 [Conger conger]